MPPDTVSEPSYLAASAVVVATVVVVWYALEFISVFMLAYVVAENFSLAPLAILFS